MKKVISMLLVCCMLALMVPGAAVETAAAAPSVEEILNDYHAKVFEARASGETGGASTYSRSGSGKTLEQETVDTLNDAGYEAYHVTAENYKTMEEFLQLDLREMGLDPNGSHILVVGGENSGSSENPNSRVAELPEEDFIDPGAGTGHGSGSFNYYHSETDRTYTMKYVTVTSDSWVLSKSVDLMETLGETIINNILNSTVTTYLDAVSGPLMIGSVASLFGFDITSEYSARSESLVLMGTAAWTRNYIYIWDDSIEDWHQTIYNEYADTRTTCTGHFYNTATGNIDLYIWDETDTVYSQYYDYPEILKDAAVNYHVYGVGNNERTGNISLYFIDRNGVHRDGFTIRETI